MLAAYVLPSSVEVRLEAGLQAWSLTDDVLPHEYDEQYTEIRQGFLTPLRCGLQVDASG
jgi:hypothetical protein